MNFISLFLNEQYLLFTFSLLFYNFDLPVYVTYDIMGMELVTFNGLYCIELY